MRLVIIAAALAVAGGAWAQAPEPEIAPVEPTAARGSAIADDDIGEAPKVRNFDPLRMLCRRVRPKTGTRIVSAKNDSRICLTQEEWERRTEVAREALRERDRGVCSGSCMTGG